MQQIDMATAKAAKATDRRALAVLAYDNATADPAGANWRAVADLLRLALPATKAKPAAIVTDSKFAPWADYDVSAVSGRRLGKSPVIVVTFAGGEIVRAPAVSLPGKPVNVGRAARVALAFYQARTKLAAGPVAVLRCICETTGAEYDPAAAAAFLAVPAAVAPAALAPCYDEGDRFNAFQWFLYRPNARRTIAATTGDNSARALRLAYAVMTLCPTLADSEVPAGPAEVETMPAAEIAAPMVESTPAAAETTPPPVAPAFKMPARFMSSSRMVPVAPARQVATSCILRVAA